MITPFHHPAILQYQYLIGLLDCTEPVGDHQRGSSFHQVVEGILYQFLRFGIEGRSGFIQNEDRWIFEHRPAMLSRCLVRPISGCPGRRYWSGNLFGIHDEIMRIGDFSRPDHIFFSFASGRPSAILLKMLSLKRITSGNKTHLAAERFHGIIADVFSIDAYVPVLTS